MSHWYVVHDGIMPKRAESTKYVIVGDRTNGRDELLQYLAERLRFPSYYSGNWDSFDECLCDLSWLSVDKVVVWHSAWPILSSVTERGCYLECLRRANAEVTHLKFFAAFPHGCIVDLERER
jgi:hypothetical protein